MAGCRQWLVAAALAAVVLLAHGGSLFDGLFFDDHWHRATLHSYGWTWNDLIESATFELPGPLANLWWLEQPLQWRYARPVAMLFMKLEYLASGGNAIVVHAFGLVWHWLCALLVYRIALWAIPATQSKIQNPKSKMPNVQGWALLAATLFVLHPQSAFGVSWIAARNALVSAFFFLAALHVYAKGSVIGRPLNAGADWGRIAAAIGLWLVALFSRETAIVFPLLVAALDLGFGGWKTVRRRIWVYVTLFALLAGYLFWRLAIFPTGGPPSIYFTTPHRLEFPLWAASKLLHMLFAHIVHTPMFLGLATHTGLSGGRWIEHVVMLGIVALVLALYASGSRGVRGRWTWLAWTLLAFVPVIPVFVMPHFSYLPAAATAIMIPLMLHRLRGGGRIVAVVFVVAYAIWPLVIYRYAWRGIVRSEQLVYADILASQPNAPVQSHGAREAPTLCFINLPVGGIYATVAMREAWQRADVNGYVLTFAPHPLMMTQPSIITQLSEREFTLETPPPGYFSGMSGTMLRDGMRPGSPLVVGTVVRGAFFDATVLEGDDAGITKFKFTFHQPLDSPELLFFVSTPRRPAMRVHFDGKTTIDTDETDSAARESRADEFDVWLRERDIYFQIIEATRRIVRSDLYLTGD